MLPIGLAVLSSLGTKLTSAFRYPALLVFAPLLLVAAHQAGLHRNRFWADDRHLHDWNLVGNDAWYDAAM